jgi:hypothetical protein
MRNGESEFVGQEIAQEAFEKGVFLGKTEPCRETKYSWWDVRYHNGKIIACVMHDDTGVSCGEEIKTTSLHLYTDNPLEAHRNLENVLKK